MAHIKFDEYTTYINIYQCSSETCEHHERVSNSFETRLYQLYQIAFANAMSERDLCVRVR